MATTVHEGPKTGSTRHVTSGSSGGNGSFIPASGGLRALDESSPASSTGVWVGMAAITMTFAAFTSALVVRQGSSTDWRHFILPPVLYLNTAVLIASSVTLEFARTRVRLFARRLQSQRCIPLLWLYATLGLGIWFVAGQYAAWLKLKSEGLYLATNPSSSFFYLFTAIHAVHVLGGLAALILVIWRFSKPASTLKVSTLSTASYYWHFVDALWIYLLLLLWTRI